MRYFPLTLVGIILALQPAMIPIASAQTMSSANGKILLEVEAHGELWYVKPDTGHRTYFANPEGVRLLMRKGIGISNANLQKIPIAILADTIVDKDQDGLSDSLEAALNINESIADTDHDGISDGIEVQNHSNPRGTGILTLDSRLGKRLSGYIVLQVEDRGQAWYILPQTNERYYLGTPQEAFKIFKKLALGISNHNIQQIPIE